MVFSFFLSFFIHFTGPEVCPTFLIATLGLQLYFSIPNFLNAFSFSSVSYHLIRVYWLIIKVK